MSKRPCGSGPLSVSAAVLVVSRNLVVVAQMQQVTSSSMTLTLTVLVVTPVAATLMVANSLAVFASCCPLIVTVW
ncbi:MAG: hypothetical protein ACKOYM_03790 [Actinomycetes bacterium]